MTNAFTPSQTNYVLGHAQTELERLIHQARLYGELTQEVLQRAGIEPGMRVLEIGSGGGDVTFLLASLVGPTGRVTGIDRSEAAVELARKRAEAAGLGNVELVVADALEYRTSQPFDAVIGRFVLPYLSDPAAALHHWASLVKPGGLMVFQEMDISTHRSLPEVNVYSTALQWVYETYRKAGLEPDMGSKLYATFRKAGLPTPQMLLGGRVESGPDTLAYPVLGQLLRTLFPLMERLGVVSAEEVGLETFEERFRAEVLALDAVIQPPCLIGAWVRTPMA